MKKSVMELLREMREDSDCSQRKIAEVLGISQQQYSKYEIGDHELPLRHFIALADYYGVSADYLIGRCSYEENKPLSAVQITPTYSSKQLVQDTLSLGDHGRQAVVEYIQLQKLREKYIQKKQKK